MDNEPVTYTLSISGGLASYMPKYEREHTSCESACEEYRRVRAEIEALSTSAGLADAHLGMVYGSDGLERSAT